MAESLGSSVLDLTVDASKLESGLSKAEGNTKSRMGKIGGLIGKAAKAATAAFAAAGAAAIAAAFQTAKYGDEVAKTAPKLGVTTDSLQEMNFWAERNGLSSGNLERALGRLNQRLGDGTAGSSKYVDALNDMGVATVDTEGKVRGTEEVFKDTIEALRGIEEPSQRSAMAAEIFGTKLGRDLMPALQDTSLSLEEAAAMANELGLVMDGDALAAAEVFQDQWANIKDQIGAFIREAAIPLMKIMADVVFPAISAGIAVLRNLFDAFKEGETTIGGFGAAASLIGEGMGALFGRLLEAAQNIFGNIVDWLMSGGLESILDGLLAGRERMFDAAMRLFPVILDALVDLIPKLIDFFANVMIPRLIQELVTAVPMLMDAALTLFSSLIDAVVEILPGLLQVLFGEVLPSLIDTLVDMAPSLLDAALEAFVMLIDAVVEVLPDLIHTLFGVVLPKLIETILEMSPKILSAALEAFFALVTGIIEVLPDIIKTLLFDVLPAIVKAIVGMMPELFQATKDLFMDMVRGIGAMLGDIGRAVMDLGSEIVSKVLGFGGRLFDAGKNIIQSMIDGIKSMFGKIGSAMGEVGSKVRNFLPFSPAKEGPLSGSGSPDRAGAQISAMVASGILQGETDVAVAMHRITDMDVDVMATGSARGLPMDPFAGDRIVVNVEGAIDPENTARTILRTLRDAERRTGDRLRV